VEDGNGTYVDTEGAFTINGVSWSDQPLYLHTFWDQDGNGVKSPGDYFDQRSFTVSNDVETGLMTLEDSEDSGEPRGFVFPEVSKLMEVMTGKDSDIPVSGLGLYDINQDDKLDMKDLIQVLRETGDIR